MLKLYTYIENEKYIYILNKKKSVLHVSKTVQFRKIDNNERPKTIQDIMQQH